MVGEDVCRLIGRVWVVGVDEVGVEFEGRRGSAEEVARERIVGIVDGGVRLLEDGSVVD
jgi:hypothetical protein